MKAVRRFNNNIVLCVTAKGKEVIARGKGIGFHEIPYDVDLKDIDTVFYDVGDAAMEMIEHIPDDMIEVSSEIVDYARRNLDIELSGNVVFALADHINFTIERYDQGIVLKLPLFHDIEHLYEKEMAVGKYALQLLRKRYKKYLPDDEAGFIALHLINSETEQKSDGMINDEIINGISSIVEQDCQIQINRQDFNYSRFVSHLHYLLKRGNSQHFLDSENLKLYQTTKEEYPQISDCADNISIYLSDRAKIDLTDEEKLYLMLHINRLCNREECNQ